MGRPGAGNRARWPRRGCLLSLVVGDSSSRDGVGGEERVRRACCVEELVTRNSELGTRRSALVVGRWTLVVVEEELIRQLGDNNEKKKTKKNAQGRPNPSIRTRPCVRRFCSPRQSPHFTALQHSALTQPASSIQTAHSTQHTPCFALLCFPVMSHFGSSRWSQSALACRWSLPLPSIWTVSKRDLVSRPGAGGSRLTLCSVLFCEQARDTPRSLFRAPGSPCGSEQAFEIEIDPVPCPVPECLSVSVSVFVCLPGSRWELPVCWEYLNTANVPDELNTPDGRVAEARSNGPKYGSMRAYNRGIRSRLYSQPVMHPDSIISIPVLFLVEPKQGRILVLVLSLRKRLPNCPRSHHFQISQISQVPISPQPFIPRVAPPTEQPSKSSGKSASRWPVAGC